MAFLCIGVIVLSWCLYKKRSRKTSDDEEEDEDGMRRVDYDAISESIDILEGRDYLEELKRRVLTERLQCGIDRPVEDLGFSRESSEEDMFAFGHDQENVCVLD